MEPWYPHQSTFKWPLREEHGVGGQPRPHRELGRWFSLEITLDAPVHFFLPSFSS